MKNKIRERIFSLKDDSDFSLTALEIFNYQYNNNTVYREFADNIGRNPGNVKKIREIPFLPVELFRNHEVITGPVSVEMIFESSGTTGTITGKHYIKDLKLYEESFFQTFRMFYGDPAEYLITALLPSYKPGSSLVYMVSRLIDASGDPSGGFYRNNHEDLIRAIGRAGQKKVLLIGVSFALLDLAEKYSPDLSGVTVMETGGMKGRRKEITRQELHSVLMEKMKISSVHSEYGMTELLSQAYSKGDGIFYCPPWMKILLRDTYDPLSVSTDTTRTGGICIIDLANIYSCSFIATSDLGKLRSDGGFEVLGRFDNSDIRGCNLMAE
jgi:phenylacetate-coenzyme A ligase PaaK-like adenylate-forming protein